MAGVNAAVRRGREGVGWGVSGSDQMTLLASCEILSHRPHKHDGKRAWSDCDRLCCTILAKEKPESEREKSERMS